MGAALLALLSLARASLGAGCIGFLDGREKPTGASPYDFAAAELNADGRLDLARANSGSSGTSILLNEPPVDRVPPLDRGGSDHDSPERPPGGHLLVWRRA